MIFVPGDLEQMEESLLQCAKFDVQGSLHGVVIKPLHVRNQPFINILDCHSESKFFPGVSIEVHEPSNDFVNLSIIAKIAVYYIETYVT